MKPEWSINRCSWLIAGSLPYLLIYFGLKNVSSMMLFVFIMVVLFVPYLLVRVLYRYLCRNRSDNLERLDDHTYFVKLRTGLRVLIVIHCIILRSYSHNVHIDEIEAVKAEIDQFVADTGSCPEQPDGFLAQSLKGYPYSREICVFPPCYEIAYRCREDGKYYLLLPIDFDIARTWTGGPKLTDLPSLSNK